MRLTFRARRRAVIAAAAIGLTALLPALALAPSPARAADGSSSVTCATGDSCEIQLEHMVKFGGRNYSAGASNLVIDITPPPCMWNPIGDAHTGSQYVLNFYTSGAPDPNAPYDQYHAYTEAKQLAAANPMPAGEWYWLPVNQNDTPAQVQACLAQPLYYWDVPGAPLPGINIPPQTLAQLAMAKMQIPGAGRMVLSPTSGVSYSNLPAFARVTLNGQFEQGPDGMPYVTDYAQLGGNAATVWVEATKLQLSSTDGAATPDTAGCDYLGSKMMIDDPKAVASTGANGKADCGVTFRQPGNWQLTATMTWRTCWAPAVVDSPPPAACNAVPGANVNPANWARNVTIHEIQAANGTG